ncbi:zinc finger BED domain-containing protein 5-like [Erpetoichthys calabaricus]|uniref:zinc finger BED domain-containing protein 5-like n=1 Tax=Erpetoichthys calabaricus TaxID=27687 RepID=UPI002234E383|nr:zinc finger BED domain-containing protein 5-like [Erpetoichthys calabaricus]
MKSAVTVSEKASEASYHVAKLIARQKRPHTIGETLIKPACMEIVRLMLGPNEVKEVNKVSLSADTVKRRIHDMSSDILGTLIRKLILAEKFALQIDESTNIKNKAQLIAIVRFVDEDFIKEHYLFCKEVPERTTGEEIFRVTDDFFKIYNIQWSNCIAICTDGAAAMTDSKKGFVSCVKQKNPIIQITHCCIHREALMVKNLPEELLNTMNECIKIINIIKSRALNSRIFGILCAEMGAEYESLLFYTEVRWLSRGKVLARLFELRYEVREFFIDQNMPELYQRLDDDYWIAKLAYMADIFEHLNELNKKMQGRNENILTCSDKLQGFKKKLELWQEELQKGCLEMYQRTNHSTTENKQLIVDLAQQHLSMLQQKFDHYFYSINMEQYDWIRNPFATNAINSTEALSLQIREEFIELSNDGTLKLNFTEVPLDVFWISVKKEYPRISDKAILTLLPFSTTYSWYKAADVLKQLDDNESDQERDNQLDDVEPVGSDTNADSCPSGVSSSQGH